MIPKPPKPGDVFCVYNRTLKAYTASQVTIVKEKGVVELDLDWVGDEPLTPEELPSLRPLMVDFLFWSRGYSLCNVPLAVPGNYRYIGNIPPLCEDDSRSYSGWGGGSIIARQRWWDSIPADRRRAFKEAAASKGGVEVAGRTVRERESKLLDKLLPFGDARELQVLPCLTTLECVQWHPGLREYLASTPFLMTLRLENHGQRTLDLRGTSVQQLIVDPDGLEELWLGENTGSLVFLKQEKAPCVIHAPREGEGVGIVFHQEVTRHPELPRLTSVHCTRVEQLDIQALADWYPGLLTLRLWGKPGYLRNIGALKDLTRLEHFTTVDLFGFGRDEVPKPEEMPHLTWLWMSSLPAAAARQVKQLYRKRQGLDLWITKPRKPEWLAENLSNPFRHWDGMEGVPLSAAKRAAALYKKLRKQLLRLAEERPGDAQAQAEAAVAAYTKPFNRMQFVETVEREEIYTVLCGILDQLPEGVLDRERLIEVFESKRDF